MRNNQIINAGCICTTEDGLWFVHYTLNVLFFWNYQQERVTLATVIPGGLRGEIAPYAGLVEHEGLLYIFPCNMDVAWIYDTKSGGFQSAQIPLKEKKNFRDAFVYKNRIYVIPYENHKCLRYKINKQTLEWIDGAGDLFPPNGIFNCASVYLEKQVLCAGASQNAILLFDMEYELWKRIALDDSAIKVTCVTSNDALLYGFDMNSCRIFCAEINGHILNWSEPMLYSSVHIAAIPHGGVAVSYTATGDVILFDKNLNMVNQFSTKPRSSALSSPFLNVFWKSTSECLWGITKGNEILQISDAKKVTRRRLFVDDGLWSNLADCLMHDNNQCYYENELVNLKGLIGAI